MINQSQKKPAYKNRGESHTLDHIHKEGGNQNLHKEPERTTKLDKPMSHDQQSMQGVKP